MLRLARAAGFKIADRPRDLHKLSEAMKALGKAHMEEAQKCQDELDRRTRTQHLRWEEGTHTVVLAGGPMDGPTHTYGPLALRWFGLRWIEERDLAMTQWQLMHVPTGRALTMLDEDPNHWKPFVERLVREFDWDWTDPSSAAKVDARRVHQILAGEV
jgi:hypothetical protein